MKAYLAGPDVFLANAIEIGARKKEICRAHGIEAHFPLDNEIEAGAPVDVAGALYRANIALMRGCDAIFANATPFRGPSLDAGTAFEIGFMRALDKAVFCYSASPALYKDKVDHRAVGEKLVDADGYDVESFGLLDNLMIEGPLREAGGQVVVRSADDLSAMAAFEACVAAVAKAAR